MEDEYITTPDDFENEHFALNNKGMFDEFIALTVRGVDEYQAMRLVFGDNVMGDQQGVARIYGLKRNPYYKREFPKQLDSVPLGEMWNPRIAIHQLVKLVRNEMAKDTARLAAIKELNVMTGITVMDEAGNTKMGRSLDDFYTKVADQAESALYDLPQATKH